MLAAIYLYNRRDETAIEALLRASRKARWNDYATDVSRSMLPLHQLVVGAYPALNRMQLLFYGSGPETWSPNWVARTAVYLAYLSDLDGDTRRGAEIRLALLRLGRLMRTQARTSRTATTGLVGEWIDYLRQKLWHWEADVDNLKPVCLARLGSLAFAVLSLITVISAPSMLRARPVGEAIVDGIRHAGLAVASVLFLLYVPAAMHTASAERRACEVLDHLTYREPQYYAQLLGTRWPD